MRWLQLPVNSMLGFESHACYPTLLPIQSFYLAKRNSKIRHNIPSTVWTTLAGCWRSKVQVLGSSHFDGVGSNPTPIMIHRYK